MIQQHGLLAARRDKKELGVNRCWLPHTMLLGAQQRIKSKYSITTYIQEPASERRTLDHTDGINNSFLLRNICTIPTREQDGLHHRLPHQQCVSICLFQVSSYSIKTGKASLYYEPSLEHHVRYSGWPINLYRDSQFDLNIKFTHTATILPPGNSLCPLCQKGNKGLLRVRGYVIPAIYLNIPLLIYIDWIVKRTQWRYFASIQDSSMLYPRR